MKTPQEQAEKLANKAFNYWNWDRHSRHFNECVIIECALPELIAVAQAAKLVLLAPRRTEIQELNALEQTFKALRATGKVEL